MFPQAFGHTIVCMVYLYIYIYSIDCMGGDSAVRVLGYGPEC